MKNFGTFVGTCSFTMPLTDLAAAANRSTRVHAGGGAKGGFERQCATSPVSERALLGLDDPSRLLDTTTDKTPRQQPSIR